MGKVHIVVNNRGYDVACDDGQEGQVTELAHDLARRVDNLVQSVGQIGDARLLLMAALARLTPELALVLGEKGSGRSRRSRWHV